MTLVELSVVTETPLDVGALETDDAAPDAAATVVFHGVVRAQEPSAAGPVTGLDYSAHPDATSYLRDVVAEANVSIHHALDSVPLPVRVVAAHRLCPLDIGDTALVVAVSAAHRQEAFGVCSDVVEKIKARVPIWKRQFGAEGSHWVGI